MMKTYQFNFSIDGKLDEIQFCDPSVQGALNLFRRFIVETYGFDADIDIHAITRVYNKDDHEYYGDEYSVPEN
jgi:hypothetical protein